VRTDYLATHPGQVEALIRAWGDAVAFYDANQAEGQAIMEAAVGAEAGSLTTAFEGVDLYDLQEAKDLMTGGGYLDTLKGVKEIALAAGIMGTDVDESALIDTSHITAVVP
jgi:NitT/TauT family transport system substrate-binding protein